MPRPYKILSVITRDHKEKRVKNPSRLLFIGTYTRKEDHVDGHAEGIYVYRFDEGKGSLEHVSTTAGIVNPSYLALHPRRPFLYAVSEINDYQGRETGAVYSYSVDRSRGILRQINSVDSRGTMPCSLLLAEAVTWISQKPALCWQLTI